MHISHVYLQHDIRGYKFPETAFSSVPVVSSWCTIKSNVLTDRSHLHKKSSLSAIRFYHQPSKANELSTQRMLTRRRREIVIKAARSAEGTKLTKEIMAAKSRIFTSRSSNCSRTSFHNGLPDKQKNTEKTSENYFCFLWENVKNQALNSHQLTLQKKRFKPELYWSESGEI